MDLSIYRVIMALLIKNIIKFYLPQGTWRHLLDINNILDDYKSINTLIYLPWWLIRIPIMTCHKNCPAMSLVQLQKLYININLIKTIPFINQKYNLVFSYEPFWLISLLTCFRNGSSEFETQSTIFPWRNLLRTLRTKVSE